MDLVDEYFAALSTADLERMLRLFAPDAEVHSPLYGVISARELYSRLFAETDHADAALRRVFRDGDTGVAFWFDYTWRLASGATAAVTAVNVAELDGDGLISGLWIVYDTGALSDDFAGEARRG
jgi:hypothetical protein